MDLWEWLVTPGGIELTHAVIGLLTAITVAVTLANHRRVTAVSSKLDKHIQRDDEDNPK